MRIFKKFEFDLEPLHVFELNILVTCALFAPAEISSRYFAGWRHVCWAVEWVRYYNWQDFITGVVLSQTDR